jgi:catechol 2,3-dioxygenase-like lactoylglutathione lyase family enzyme
LANSRRHSFKGVHHILLSVPPEQKEAAHRFYEDVLGFEPLSVAPEIGSGDRLWWYDCGAAQVHIALEPEFRAHHRAHPAILVQNLAALGEQLVQAGVETRWDDHYPGLRRFYIRDPFGNRLEFAEPIT